MLFISLHPVVVQYEKQIKLYRLHTTIIFITSVVDTKHDFMSMLLSITQRKEYCNVYVRNIFSCSTAVLFHFK
jgi:hypothetical protein